MSLNSKTITSKTIRVLQCKANMPKITMISQLSRVKYRLCYRNSSLKIRLLCSIRLSSEISKRAQGQKIISWGLLTKDPDKFLRLRISNHTDRSRWFKIIQTFRKDFRRITIRWLQVMSRIDLKLLLSSIIQ
jgi:hypothetical protein